MSIKKKNYNGSGELSRIVALVATLTILFFLTRSTPFASSTYWELSIARDFGSLSSGWVFTPEKIALSIVNSRPSMLGLKALYHMLFFLICAMLCLWIFKCKEPLPGIVILFFFALAMQIHLDFRMLLTIFSTVGLMMILDSNLMKDDFGIMLIPITASASAMGLNAWLMIVLVTCYVVVIDDLRPSLILCALIGLLFFPEGAAAAANFSSVWSWHFAVPIEQKLVYIIAAILLLINIVNLAKLAHEDMPALIFCVVTGFMSLVNPYYMPLFIVVSIILLFKSFSDIEQLSMNSYLVGIVLITIIINLFLFSNSFGINLNPTVKHHLGDLLTPVIEGKVKEMPIKNYNIGELAWKGIISIDKDQLPLLFKRPNWKLKQVYKDEYVLENSE